MKVATKYENLKGMEVELYESIFRDEYDNVECPTYGIKIKGVVFDDISVEKDVVSSLVNLINKMMSGDKEAKQLIHCMLVESVSDYEADIINF